ncbi:hypothetical protein MMC25_001962 [Agyrium rufum]|nr:hypothetical protein [Agyrium rufum]
MPPSRLASGRAVLHLRNGTAEQQCSASTRSVRSFAQKSRLLLISHPPYRPQLPFLYATHTLRTSPITLTRFEARFLTVESKRVATWVASEARKAMKWTLYIWTTLGLVALIKFGIDDERMDRLFPTPEEWTWFQSRAFRRARADETYGTKANAGLPNWMAVGMVYRALLCQLEGVPKLEVDFTTLPVEEQVRLGRAGHIIDGFRTEGIDISRRSYEWRQGYFECLMGIARAAEFLDGIVYDVVQKTIFHTNRIIGPSNPNPVPQPPGASPPPREENCIPSFLSPDFIYAKLLATEGFDARQRQTAALSWANWLAAKEPESGRAEDKYDWALDVAMGDLPAGVNNVVDIKTGCINPNATHITEGIITATSALAAYHAQKKDFATALPIFLSILRAYKNLPFDLLTLGDTTNTRVIQNEPADPSSDFRAALESLLKPQDYPDPPPSISEPLNADAKELCLSTSIMTHIGEIIFAASLPKCGSIPPPPSISDSSSASARTGQPHPSPSNDISILSALSWTRSAFETATEYLESIMPDPANPNTPRSQAKSTTSSATKKKLRKDQLFCAECVDLAAENWKRMLSILEESEFEEEVLRRQGLLRSQQQQQQKKTEGKSWFGSWFWSSSPSTAERTSPTSSPPSSAPSPTSSLDEENTTALASIRTEMQKQRQQRDIHAMVKGFSSVAEQGPWAQEARRVDERVKEVQGWMRKMELQRKDPVEMGLWGLG